MDFNSSIKNNQNHDSTISEKKKKSKRAPCIKIIKTPWNPYNQLMCWLRLSTFSNQTILSSWM